jgi:hypothetical protein
MLYWLCVMTLTGRAKSEDYRAAATEQSVSHILPFNLACDRLKMSNELL